MKPVKRKKQVALVLFGGKGERFGAEKPKQFELLGEENMFVTTLKAFSACSSVDAIFVVVEASTMEECRDLILKNHIGRVKAIIKGGLSRQESARRGLEYLANHGMEKDDLVLIADGDRPNVDPDIVSENFIAALELGSACTAIPVTDSVMLEDGGQISSYLDRNHVYRAQTPQTFRFGSILKAHRKGRKRPFTDDASLYQKYIGKVFLVKGSEDNIKITVKEDVDTYLRLKEKKDDSLS